MIIVINKRCLENNCNKTPIYNFENEKEALYCSEHKKNDMVNVITKKCKEQECKKKKTTYILFTNRKKTTILC